MRKTKMKIFATFCVLGVLLMPFFYVSAQTDAELKEIQQQIDAKKQYIKDLNAKAEQYKTAISQKQKELVTLKSQVSILENKIEKNKIDIETTEVELQEIKLEIRTTEIEIVLNEDQIKKKKDNLTILVREFFQQDQESVVHMIFGYSSVAEFFQQLGYLKNLESSIHNKVPY